METSHSHCPDCGKEIHIDPGVEIRSNLCPYCGAQLGLDSVDDGTDTVPARIFSTTIKLVFAGCVLFILISLLFICTHSNVGKLSQTQSVKKNLVELVSMTWGENEDGKTIEVFGQVKNISDTQMPGLQAVVIFYDKQNSVLSRGTTNIKESLTPGQVYPFRLSQNFNPAMEKAGIIFLSLKGDTLRTETTSNKSKK